MHLDTSSGLIDSARHLPSENFDQRDIGAEPECIIVHCISLPPGEYGGDQIERFFTNQLAGHEHPYFTHIADLRVSAHFLVKRDGELIQFVATHDRAWHAGESVCLQRPKVNNFSIGIELEGLDTDPNGFTDAQYRELRELIASLRAAYPNILESNIFAHSDIAPGRKPDPGPYFNWQRLFEL
ncbi:1,6-anhydro-N-acetylmuramyl-L-alanine amidase AmpD [Arenicella xantha]|uniref:1,6-anhydro-N-acetylmuramyl-L-alanine amidase AmpD n=1 Tax=Arenicella xantha TaxID=644221 RepID=A0A395JJT3_9GAMM|nr:1,6-anhydro-N-acetylmuramyl-L-alanine amidase AmpD [Arenicella xantha]RBP50779.1 AmpD protein [Arenicella xantha]